MSHALATALALPHLGASEAVGLVASYLLGAIPFGFVLVRLVKGVDLRTVGSGNIGATNAMRVLGKPLGLVAFLLDFAKGLVPVVVFAPLFASAPSTPLRVLMGAAAVVGHVFPIYLRFKGGKAVATGRTGVARRRRHDAHGERGLARDGARVPRGGVVAEQRTCGRRLARRWRARPRGADILAPPREHRAHRVRHRAAHRREEGRGRGRSTT